MPPDILNWNIVLKNCRHFQAGEIWDQFYHGNVDFNFNCCSLGRNLKPLWTNGCSKTPTCGQSTKDLGRAAAFYLNVKNCTSHLFLSHLIFAISSFYRWNQVTSLSKVPPSHWSRFPSGYNTPLWVTAFSLRTLLGTRYTSSLSTNLLPGYHQPLWVLIFSLGVFSCQRQVLAHDDWMTITSQPRITTCVYMVSTFDQANSFTRSPLTFTTALGGSESGILHFTDEKWRLGKSKWLHSYIALSSDPHPLYFFHLESLLIHDGQVLNFNVYFQKNFYG